MKSSIVVLASLCALLVSVNAQTTGNCVFNSTLCTCLFGSADGDCWDPLDGNPGLCSKRVCDAGWTCDCDGDYFCHRGPVTVSVVEPAEVDSNPAACTTVDDELRINMPGCVLGFFHPIISPTGFAAGSCQNWVWWLNGGDPANIFSNTGAPAADLNALTQWNDLPLKPGDVVAHRFANEWEECYSGAELSVNGTIATTEDTTRYRTAFTNIFENNWWEPGFDDSAWETVWPIPFGSDIWTNDDVNGPPVKTNSVPTNTYIRITVL